MEKNEKCNEWYKCYRHLLCGQLLQWIRDKLEQGVPYDNKGGDFADNYTKLTSGSSEPAQPAPVAPAKVEEKKVAP